MKTAVVLWVSLFAAASAFSAVIQVPDDYPTIQEAIEAAATGDTVEVGPGTYFENIDFLGKAITVLGRDGFESTFIDGQEQCVVTFASGEGPDTVLEGFTVTNGAGESAAGILCQHASPSIRNNAIEGNRAVYFGGGLYCLDAVLNLEGNRFKGNEAFSGAGIYCSLTDLTLTDNLFQENRAFGSGGGAVHATNASSLNVANNTFVDNEGFCGGGVYLTLSPATFSANLFSGNQAVYAGGGVFSYDLSHSTVTGNTFENNTAYTGGGFCVFFCDATFQDNSFTGNAATGSGGGLSCQDGVSASLTSNRFVGNSAAQNGGAVHCEQSELTVTDNDIGPESGTEVNEAARGGGLYCAVDSVLEITDNRFRGNGGTACEAGGALYSHACDLVVRSNVIGPNNRATEGRGGGVCCEGETHVLFEENTVSGGIAQEGGGVYLSTCTGTFNDNTVTQCYAVAGSGGGVSLIDTQSPVNRNVLSNNTAVNGGGLYVVYAPDDNIDVDYADNVVHDNIASESGGGVIFDVYRRFVPYCERLQVYSNHAGTSGGAIVCRSESKPKILNALLYGNTALRGGAFSAEDICVPKLKSSVIYGNEAIEQGGGLYNSSTNSNPVIVRNAIFWGNTASEGTQIYDLAGSEGEVTYCDVEDGWPGEGNIQVDPLFQNPAGGEFHLTRYSPCINMGTSDTGDVPRDMDQETRPYKGLFDIGPDEFTGELTLDTSASTLSAHNGGTITFFLAGGPQKANREYLLLGTTGDRSPGVPLPGKAVLPLNWDFFTDLIIVHLNTGIFQNFYGHLDGAGDATAILTAQGPLPANFTGKSLYFAYLLSVNFELASNPMLVTITN